MQGAEAGVGLHLVIYFAEANDTLHMKMDYENIRVVPA
jgi:hypothetical protein